MIEQDIFVGVVALGLGIFVTSSAILNSAWFSKFWLSRMLDQSCGPIWSRRVGGILGILVAILGVLIMIGFFTQSQRSQLRRKFWNQDNSEKLVVRFSAVSRKTA